MTTRASAGSATRSSTSTARTTRTSAPATTSGASARTADRGDTVVAAQLIAAGQDDDAAAHASRAGDAYPRSISSCRKCVAQLMQGS